MFAVRLAPGRRRAMASVLLGLHLAGCTRWAPVSQPIPEVLEAHPRAGVRLTLDDGKRLELKHIRILSDSLVGVSLIGPSESGVLEPWDKPDTVAVALADIRRMEVEQGTGAAAGIVAGVILLVVIAAVAVSQALDNSDMGF